MGETIFPDGAIVESTNVDDEFVDIESRLGIVVSASILASASSQVLDSFSALSDGMCEWVYQLEQGNNVRGGTLIAFWDASASTAKFTDTHPEDIGTITIAFDVDHDGSSMRLRASNSDASNAYSFTATRREPTGLSGYGNVKVDPTVLQRVDDMTFETVKYSKYGAITVFANGTGKVIVTSAGHGLSNGDKIEIGGTTSYNGIWTIADVATDTFTIPATWVANDATGGWVEYNLYFSQDQSNADGKVIKQRFEGTLAGTTTTLIVAGVDAPVLGGGYFQDGTQRMLIGGAVSTGGGGAFQVMSNVLSIRAFGAWGSGDAFDIWIDYTKVVDPTTSPTGQPFADPNSPLLKRVDTGAWVVPVTNDGIEYYSGEWYRGKQVIMQVKSGTTASTEWNTLIADADITEVLSSSIGTIDGGTSGVVSIGQAFATAQSTARVYLSETDSNVYLQTTSGGMRSAPYYIEIRYVK